jgi:hypothetical protein
MIKSLLLERFAYGRSPQMRPLVVGLEASARSDFV